jgi:2-amino-4-hydroxy-6-hydroxymethyldihydropteridine diphosphokinase
MARCYVSVGSNVDRERHIRVALEELRNLYGAIRFSAIYENSAVGFKGDPFFNLVVEFHTDQPVDNVTATLHAIEERHGRDRRGPRFAPRTLDIDLLLYDDLVRNDDDVEVPRTDIMQHAFVLRPLAELNPSGRHPLTGEPFSVLWDAFDKRGLDLRPIDLN